MLIAKSVLGTAILLLIGGGAIAPASAQWGNSIPWGSHRHPNQSSNVIVGDRVHVNPSSSLLINGHRGYEYYQPSTVIIIQQPTPYYRYAPSACTTSVVGSPIPLPYARDSRTGALCQ